MITLIAIIATCWIGGHTWDALSRRQHYKDIQEDRRRHFETYGKRKRH